MNLSHLHAIEQRLVRERTRFAIDQSPARAVWVAQAERELVDERKYLGLEPQAECHLSDADLLRELGQ